MNRRVLIIDIGNSRTKIGIFEKGSLVDLIISETEPLKFIKSQLKKYNPADFFVSSVRSTDDLKEILGDQKAKRLLTVDSNVNFKSQYKTPKTLGKDRIAVVAGVREIDPKSAHLIIDAGTCVTYDWVDSHGCYWGGNIAPGLRMRLAAMNTMTSQLPLGELYEPLTLWGQSTNEALYNGAFWGLISEINQYYQSTSFKDCRVWLTGGDAELLSSKLEIEHVVDKTLLLKGLYEIYKLNN